MTWTTWDCGSWTMALGPWLSDRGSWTMGLRPWLWDCVSWTMGLRQWVLDHGSQTVGLGPWVSDCGSWTMALRLWVLDHGSQTVGLRLWVLPSRTMGSWTMCNSSGDSLHIQNFLSPSPSSVRSVHCYHLDYSAAMTSCASSPYHRLFGLLLPERWTLSRSLTCTSFFVRAMLTKLRPVLGSLHKCGWTERSSARLIQESNPGHWSCSPVH